MGIPAHPLTNLPIPLALDLQVRYALTTFVETGTANGETAELMAAFFDQVFTVEIDEERFQRVKEKLLGRTNVIAFLGTSPDFIRSIGHLLRDEGVLYFLDAHWCGGNRYGTECPILDELRAISEVFTSRHVIMIDDARLFINPPPPPHISTEWPTIREIEAFVSKWNNPYATMRVDGDTIIIEPNVGSCVQ